MTGSGAGGRDGTPTGGDTGPPGGGPARPPPGFGFLARGGFLRHLGGSRNRQFGAQVTGRGRGSRGRTAQDGAVVRVAQAHHGFRADLDPVEPLESEERPVGAAEVLDDPAAAVHPQHGMPPGDARVGHDDVGLGVPADAVGGAGLHVRGPSA